MERTCKRCEETLPIESFHRNGITSGGRQRWKNVCRECSSGQKQCRECRNVRPIEIFELKDGYRGSVCDECRPGASRVCAACEQDLPITDFHRNGGGLRRKRCKTCTNARRAIKSPHQPERRKAICPFCGVRWKVKARGYWQERVDPLSIVAHYVNSYGCSDCQLDQMRGGVQ